MSETGSLQSFISEVKNGGLMKSSHFAVSITVPTDANNRTTIPGSFASSQAMKKYIMFCDSTNLPGTSLGTVDVSAYGETRESPTQRIYDPVNLTFYVDNDMNIKKFFDSWINSIINPITRNHAYYKNYTTLVDIIVYDSEHNEKYKVTLHEAFPKSVSDIQLSYTGDGVMKLSVSMQYRYYTVFNYETNDVIESADNTKISNFLKQKIGDKTASNLLGGYYNSLRFQQSDYIVNPTRFQSQFQ
jgi:hypothetical protein